MQEIWKDIPEFEGEFKTNNLGQIWDIKKNDWVPYEFRSLFGYGKWHSGMGYLCCSLNGKLYSVHILVAKAFIPNPDNLPCVNHRNENPSDNRVENLMWCTHKGNSNWGTLPERRKQWGREKAKRIAMIDDDGEIVEVFDAVSDAAKTLNNRGIKVNIYNISAVLNKRLQKGADGKLRVRMKAGGYHWEFIEQTGS